MTKEKVHVVEGRDIAVRYNLKRCIHAEKCVRGLPAVFDPSRRPWIQPDKSPVERVSAVVMQCPTGALAFDRKDGGEVEPLPETNTLLVIEDGPLYVRGNVHLTTSDDIEVKRETRLALCRCGASVNKPYCDNSHLESGFQASSSVANYQTETVDQNPTSILKVIPTLNGPVMLRGNFEIRNSEGASMFRGMDTEFCRCGGSQNKPFCDGTHKRIGFSSE